MEGLARPKEGGLGGYAHSAVLHPWLSFSTPFRTLFRSFFVAFFGDVFSRLWEGFRRHFGAILEVKIHKKCIKNRIVFLIDLLNDFLMFFGGILDGFSSQKSVTNQ